MITLESLEETVLSAITGGFDPLTGPLAPQLPGGNTDFILRMLAEQARKNAIANMPANS